MRALIAGCLILLPMVFVTPGATPVLAQEGCRCEGCGCKGGPGWRGPEGRCVSQRNFAQVCGSPPGEPCKHEGAKQICFEQQSSLRSPEAQSR